MYKKNRYFLILYTKNIVPLHIKNTSKYNEYLQIFFLQTGHALSGYGRYYLATKCSGTNSKG